MYCNDLKFISSQVAQGAHTALPCATCNERAAAISDVANSVLDSCKSSLSSLANLTQCIGQGLAGFALFISNLISQFKKTPEAPQSPTTSQEENPVHHTDSANPDSPSNPTVYLFFKCHLFPERAIRTMPIDMPPNSTVNELCNQVAEAHGLNPATTYVTFFFGGQKQPTPKEMSKPALDFTKIYEEVGANLHTALVYSLSDEECQEFCSLLEKNNFPNLPQHETPEKTIEIVRGRLSEECNKVFQQEQGRGSQELEKPRACLNAIKNYTYISMPLKRFVAGLTQSVNAAYDHYSAGVSDSVDATKDSPC